MSRRTLALVACLLLAGCGAAGGPTPDPFTGTDEPAPDPDVRVVLDNEWNRTVTVDLRVTRVATNETVHEATHDVAPGGEREVYSLAAAGPEGVERFRVTATARGATRSVSVETSACYGDVYGYVEADGSVGLTYAVC